MNKPLCKVNGRIAPGAMCGSIIVGMKYCGFAGECQHKEVVTEPPATTPGPEVAPVPATDAGEKS